MSNLIINGNANLKEPSTLSIQKNKLWATKSGRASSGKFVGNIQAIKYRIDVTWKALSEEEASAISKALEPDFFNVTFKDPTTGQMLTKTFYAGDENYTIYSYGIAQAVYDGLPISLVEQ